MPLPRTAGEKYLLSPEPKWGCTVRARPTEHLPWDVPSPTFTRLVSPLSHWGQTLAGAALGGVEVRFAHLGGGDPKMSSQARDLPAVRLTRLSIRAGNWILRTVVLSRPDSRSACPINICT